MTNTLKERVAQAWHETYVGVRPWDDLPPAARATLIERARIALTALGLDDVDAAVARIAEEREARRLYTSTDQIRAVIEALFATEEP